ncbi:hypothetical protein [Vibrio sp. Y2-5]|uniref:hypothetical protein n=1 Tax=Vibrio sp. Y2-5 TaxID=2743977 RepID=UPI001CB6E089|nr:hypothetical protein [Vibrio sp. Y2-5]
MSAASEISLADAQMADVMVITSDESTSAAVHIERGRGVVTSSHASIDSLVDNIEMAMTKAEELEKNSEAISSVLEIIRGIAEQTDCVDRASKEIHQQFNDLNSVYLELNN